MDFQKIVDVLTQCDIKRGVWIDAGCGHGTYTFPLANLASQVIALDKNANNLSFLESKIPLNANISTQQFDFSNPSWYKNSVDGILFGFSLHYDPIHTTALKHAYQQLKQGGKLVVIEYSTEKSVPWVPYPLPFKKLNKILTALSYSEIQVINTFPLRKKGINWNNASYMITALK